MLSIDFQDSMELKGENGPELPMFFTKVLALGAVGSFPLKTAALASTTYETHGKEFVSSTFLIFS